MRQPMDSLWRISQNLRCFGFRRNSIYRYQPKWSKRLWRTKLHRKLGIHMRSRYRCIWQSNMPLHRRRRRNHKSCKTGICVRCLWRHRCLWQSYLYSFPLRIRGWGWDYNQSIRWRLQGFSFTKRRLSSDNHPSFRVCRNRCYYQKFCPPLS